MTKIKITQLVWDSINVEHIKKKHTVTVAEVEDSIQQINAHKIGYAGRIFLIGRTGKRILAVLLKPQAQNKYYVVTARDADKKERKLLYENEKK